jgi:hypothetical protein
MDDQFPSGCISGFGSLCLPEFYIKRPVKFVYLASTFYDPSSLAHHNLIIALFVESTGVVIYKKSDVGFILNG